MAPTEITLNIRWVYNLSLIICNEFHLKLIKTLMYNNIDNLIILKVMCDIEKKIYKYEYMSSIGNRLKKRRCC